MKETSKAWDIRLDGKLLDTVSYNATCDASYVRRSLIEHDGYPSEITVRAPKKA